MNDDEHRIWEESLEAEARKEARKRFILLCAFWVFCLLSLTAIGSGIGLFIPYIMEWN